MTFWEADNLRNAIGGSWVRRPEPGLPLVATGVSIDSRTLARGEAFLAVKGDRFDGHAFLPTIAQAGASLAIVEADATIPSDTPASFPIIRVTNTRRALLRLATAYRESLDSRVKVIAVTGSNGKTTTTRLIEGVLSASLPGVASQKSFNNHLGVPLTILRARATHRFLICEIGTNRPGEVAELARIVQPHVSVITSIGREHLQELGSLDRIAREEASQIEFTRQGGLAIVNGDAPPLVDAAKSYAQPRGVNLYMFGTTAGCDLRISEPKHHWMTQPAGSPSLGFRVTPPKGGATFNVPLIGLHNAHNAAAAIAVGRRLGLSDDAIAAGLASVKPAEMRCQFESIPTSADHPITIINDAYNANPESMHAGLSMLIDLPVPATRGRRVVILGDMLELGPQAPSLHEEIVRRVAGEAAIDAAIFVGPLMTAAARAIPQASGAMAVHDLQPETLQRITASIRPGDLALVKGSRGMRLERIVESLRSRVQSDHPAIKPGIRPSIASASPSSPSPTTATV